MFSHQPSGQFFSYLAQVSKVIIILCTSNISTISSQLVPANYVTTNLPCVNMCLHANSSLVVGRIKSCSRISRLGVKCSIGGHCTGISCKILNSLSSLSPGDHCQTDIDECDLDPCLNGGTCENHNGTYNCSCDDGYEGENCETANCDEIDCANNGNCTITVDGQWECECLEFYEGQFNFIIR